MDYTLVLLDGLYVGVCLEGAMRDGSAERVCVWKKILLVCWSAIGEQCFVQVIMLALVMQRQTVFCDFVRSLFLAPDDFLLVARIAP